MRGPAATVTRRGDIRSPSGLGEQRNQAQTGRDVDGEFAATAVEVLHEIVATDDHLYCFR